MMSARTDTPTLEGFGLVLRPLAWTDVDGLAAIASPAVGEFFGDQIDTYEAMESYVQRGLLDGQAQSFVVESNGEVVGQTRLFRLDAGNRNGEIGHTFYAQKVWRTHVNTSAKVLMLRHAFETMKLIRVSFRTDSRNVRSQNAIARLGAHLEGVNRNDRILWTGYVRSSVNYSILAEEWPAVEADLLAKLGAPR